MTDEFEELDYVQEKADQNGTSIGFELGIYFGYPVCCINAFLEDCKKDKPVERFVNNKGFVPCEFHYYKIINGEVQAKDLIKNRECQIPYENS